MSPGGMPPGGAARRRDPRAGGTASGAGGAGIGGMAARASRWLGVRAMYCDLTTAICTCSWLCLDCRSARTAAACSAAVLASAADLADASSALAACSPISAVARHLRRHLGGHHPLDRQLVDETLRRVGGQHRVHAVGPAAHVLRCSKLVDRRLECCQLRFGGVHRCLVGGVLCIGGLLRCQLVIQVELGRMHRLGGLLGLPRQLIELCQRIVGGVCLHIARRATPPKTINPAIAPTSGSLKLTARDPRACGRASRFCVLQTAVASRPELS